MPVPQPTLHGPSGGEYGLMQAQQFMAGMGQLTQSLQEKRRLQQQQYEFDTNTFLDQFKQIYEGPFQKNWKAMTVANPEMSKHLAMVMTGGDEKLASALVNRWDSRPPTSEEIPLLGQLFQNKGMIAKYGGDVEQMLNEAGLSQPEGPGQNVSYTGEQTGVAAGYRAQGQNIPMSAKVPGSKPQAGPPAGSTVKLTEWTIVDTAITGQSRGALRALGYTLSDNPNVTIEELLERAKTQLKLKPEEMEDARKELLNGAVERGVIKLLGKRPEGDLIGRKMTFGGAIRADAVTGAAPRPAAATAETQPILNKADVDWAIQQSIPASDKAKIAALPAGDYTGRVALAQPFVDNYLRSQGITYLPLQGEANSRPAFVARINGIGQNGEEAAQKYEQWAQSKGFGSTWKDAVDARQHFLDQAAMGRQPGDFRELQGIAGGQMQRSAGPATDQVAQEDRSNSLTVAYHELSNASDAAIEFAKSAYEKVINGQVPTARESAAQSAVLSGLLNRAKTEYRRAVTRTATGGKAGLPVQFDKEQQGWVNRLGMPIEGLAERMTEIANMDPQAASNLERLDVPLSADERRQFDLAWSSFAHKMGIDKGQLAIEVAKLSLAQRVQAYEELLNATMMELQSGTSSFDIPSGVASVYGTLRESLDKVFSDRTQGVPPEKRQQVITELISEEKGEKAIADLYKTVVAMDAMILQIPMQQAAAMAKARDALRIFPNLSFLGLRGSASWRQPSTVTIPSIWTGMRSAGESAVGGLTKEEAAVYGQRGY